MADVKQAIEKVIAVEIGPNQIEHQVSKGDSGNYNSQGLVGTSYGYSGGLAELINHQPYFANGTKNPDFQEPADKAYMQNLTHENVVSIYENNQAFQMQIGNFSNQHVANLMLDHAIHNDTSKATTLLQAELAINNPNPQSPIAIDGKMGEETIKTMQQFDQVVLHNTLADARIYGYGNYTGNTPSEREAFQNRVLENYPHLPMTPVQQNEYENMLQVHHLQEYVGVKADGIPGQKTWDSVKEVHEQNKWEYTDNKLSPDFVNGLHTWAQEKGVIENVHDTHKDSINYGNDSKGFSNHENHQSSEKVTPHQSVTDHKADTLSNNVGDHSGI